jgi:hypothetical protein
MTGAFLYTNTGHTYEVLTYLEHSCMHRALEDAGGLSVPDIHGRLEKKSSTRRNVKTQIYTLYRQLQVKSNDTPIGTVLVELCVCGVQGVFGGHHRNFWTVLSAGYPAANQSQVRS